MAGALTQTPEQGHSPEAPPRVLAQDPARRGLPHRTHGTGSGPPTSGAGCRLRMW